MTLLLWSPQTLKELEEEKGLAKQDYTLVGYGLLSFTGCLQKIKPIHCKNPGNMVTPNWVLANVHQ